MMKRLILLGVFVFGVAVLHAGAFDYQANLVRKDGTPVTTSVKLRFALKDDTNATTTLWQGGLLNDDPVTPDSTGLVRVTVHNSENDYATVVRAAKGDLFLVLSVLDPNANDALLYEFVQNLLPAPMASHAQVATHAEGEFHVSATSATTGKATGLKVTGNATIEEDVQATKLTAGGGTVEGELTATALIIGTEGTRFPGQLPVGSILPWSGNGTLPEGWLICDGSSGTVDLRGYFVRGASKASELKQTGGNETVSLTANQLPPHTHGYNQNRPNAVDGRPDGWRDRSNDHLHTYGYWYGDAATPTADSSPVGEGKAHENLPPYWALYYIQRVR